MGESERNERELRAARNQALFRAVNDQLETLTRTGTFPIACECADTNCVETLQIRRDEYDEVRRNPRHFAVLPGHVYPDVETVVKDADAYVVVEKLAAAGEAAEELDARRRRPSDV
jgi:hypothetical protein